MTFAFRLIVTIAVLAGCLVLLVEQFLVGGLVQPHRVMGNSMLPTLQPGQRLLVIKFLPPQRGDVVAVQSPDAANTIAVKRVVGLPGETIALAEGQLTADGLPVMVGGREAWGEGSWTIPAAANPQSAGWVVLGDNLRVSRDSRHWPGNGRVHARHLRGLVRRWPFRLSP